MSAVEAYQRLLIEFEVYLNQEIREWGNVSEASGKQFDDITFEVLLDLKDELERLKALYFPPEDK
jgi:hypothetical protein